MSPTVTTTESPSAQKPFSISQAKLFVGLAGHVLTPPYSRSGGAAFVAPSASSQPPPAKRQKPNPPAPPSPQYPYERWLYWEEFCQKLRVQIQYQLSNRVDNPVADHNITELVLRNLDNPVLFGKYMQHNAQISPEFQKAVFAQIPLEIEHALAYEIQRLTSSPQLRIPFSSAPRTVTPVPPPVIPNHGAQTPVPVRTSRQPTGSIVINRDNGITKPPASLSYHGARPTTPIPLPHHVPPSAPVSLLQDIRPPAPAQQTLPPHTPRPPRAPIPAQLGKQKKAVPTSPSNFRTRAHASVWHGKRDEGSTNTQSRGYFSELTRPYISAQKRKSISMSTSAFMHVDTSALANPVAIHVDFNQEEILALRAAVCRALESKEEYKDPRKDLRKHMRHMKKQKIPLSSVLEAVKLPRRSTQDIERFLVDIKRKEATKTPSAAVVLTLQRDPYDHHGAFARASKIPDLLLSREISGQRGHHHEMRNLTNFTNEFQKCREDDLELKEEWTGCAGDISTIVWVSNDSFICGTTAHSDAHNQQYNKPGNLVLGSCNLRTVRAYPQHRIIRPIVSKGENSTDAMRESQDPWLYSSVVSSCYDAGRGLAFTSGFDRTVKVWEIQDPSSGPSMGVVGEWRHDGNVNFVVSSKYESGMVATAADVAVDAIRIYKLQADITRSPYQSYSCSRVTDDRGNTVSTDKWAYFPATMQWGLAPGVQHLLLVGYSPRSRTGEDNDIPEDRRDSGELCLWNGLTGERWKITSATTQNVFEVIWHPSQVSFIAATSPVRLDVDRGVRTQIQIYRLADNSEFGGKAFSLVKTLDCAALDINELTIRPNSYTFCYITAGCTDGKVYVWDTSQGDKPIHVLKHGEPIDEYRGEREREDIGVKFTAWGNTPDRLYTGSSDGVIKVWNVRSLKKPLVRDLLEVPAPISCGSFSPDRSNLVVGDASGRVFLLSLDNDPEEQRKDRFQTFKLDNGEIKVVRRPKQIIQHPEPHPPRYNAHGQLVEWEDSATLIKRAKGYLEKQQLALHPCRHLGVVKGPNYAELGLYRRECHHNEDPTQPLVARWENLQDDSNKVNGSGPSRRYQLSPLRPVVADMSVLSLHEKNEAVGLDIAELAEETKRQLISDGVDLEDVESPSYVFDYEDDKGEDEDEDEDEWQ